jgi:hypothetical protein
MVNQEALVAVANPAILMVILQAATHAIASKEVLMGATTCLDKAGFQVLRTLQVSLPRGYPTLIMDQRRWIHSISNNSNRNSNNKR